MKSETTDKTTDKPPATLLGILAAGGVLVGMVVVFFCIIVWCIQGLWNIVIPDVFGLKPLTFLQAFSLTTLTHLLFGSNSLWKSKNSNK